MRNAQGSMVNAFCLENLPRASCIGAFCIGH
jgi:hypothetical protein